MSLEILNGIIGIAQRQLLRDVNVQLRTGEFVAVLGPNGVGKTTLLRTLAGVHPIAGGNVRINEIPLTAIHPVERARKIALVASDDTFIEDLHVHEVVASGRYPFHRWWQWNATPHDDSAVHRALKAVEMQSYAERLFATLSSGERQRVWIALALAQEASIVLLDEPTSHLDIRAVHEILALLRNQARVGKTIVCAIHDVNDALAHADRLMLLGDGRVVAYDTPENILATDALETIYGITMERSRSTDGSLRVFARL